MPLTGRPGQTGDLEMRSREPAVTDQTDLIRRMRRLSFILWLGAAGLLLVPLIAMQYSDEVQWTAFDFVFAGGMLFGSLAVFELALWRAPSLAYLGGVIFALGTSFVLIWVSGAVGIIGSEDNPANLWFLGIPLLVAIWAVAGMFRARVLMLVMFAAALAQVAIGAWAVIGNLGAEDPNWPMDAIGATVVLSIGWLLAGGLFRVAAHRPGA